MHKIILLSGKQGSGKSTLADGLEKAARDYGFAPVRTRFAKVLYEMHNAACAVAKKYGVQVNPKEGEMLQWIGTEWGRILKGQNVWVSALKTDVEQTMKSYLPGHKLCFIIDDMRFQNEFDAFSRSEELGVFKLRLEADRETRKARCSYWRENDTHPSETGLDHLVDFLKSYQGEGFDTIINSGVLKQDEVLAHAVDLVFK